MGKGGRRRSIWETHTTTKSSTFERASGNVCAILNEVFMKADHDDCAHDLALLK